MHTKTSLNYILSINFKHEYGINIKKKLAKFKSHPKPKEVPK